ALDLVLARFREGRGAWLLRVRTSGARIALVGWMVVLVRPQRLRTYALLGHRLDAVTDLCAAVDENAVLDRPLVVIDEQPRGNEICHLLLPLIDPNGPGDGIGGATADLSLIVNRRAVPPQVG